ncbi:hypothetical protein Hanom_Chr16g01505721 [Helianthus anomalus]
MLFLFCWQPAIIQGSTSSIITFIQFFGFLFLVLENWQLCFIVLVFMSVCLCIGPF